MLSLGRLISLAVHVCEQRENVSTLLVTKIYQNYLRGHWDKVSLNRLPWSKYS